MNNKKISKEENSILPLQSIESRIYFIRQQKVILDSDLAELYEVETKTLNRAVKRNISRFPEDFMFQLTESEFDILRYQFGTSNNKRGGRRYLPYAFTQEGIAMLSSVLNSEQAIQVNIAIMRAFVKLRQFIVSNEELAKKLTEFEKKTDARFQVVFDTIKKLIKAQIPAPPSQIPKKQIGFVELEKDKKD
ncbi:MAG: ORF6N domain-containing protein [Blastocatellia bacterium]